MMIKIKMSEPGSQELEDAIQDVNRRAKRHTFTAYDLAFYVAVEAERRLEKLGIPKTERAGAMFTAESGTELPNAYHGVAVAATATILRRSRDWYLISYERYDLWPNHRPRELLALTPDQDALAIKVLRQGYSTDPVLADRARFVSRFQVAA
jgi:hypothetical protein